jgi:hypothetical protein
VPSDDKRILATLVKRMKNRDVDPLRPLIDEYYLMRGLVPPEQRAPAIPIDLVPRPRPPGRLSPSTIGGCQRQAAFRFIGVRGRRRLDPDLEAIFEHGNWTHHKWQHIFRDMEMVLGKDIFEVLTTEATVQYPKLYISGSSDNTVKLYGSRKVIDIKSIADFGFTKVFTDDAPKEEHVSQLMVYMRGHRIYEGLLHYENKNNQRTRTFKVAWDAQRWEWVRDWCAQVLRRMMRRELPPMHPDCDAGTYLWERCPYSGLCFGKMSKDQLTEHVYVDFKGVKEQWRTGNQLSDAALEDSSLTLSPEDEGL